MAYDASRCADPASLESLRAWDMLVGSDLRFLFFSGRPASIEVAHLAAKTISAERHHAGAVSVGQTTKCAACCRGSGASEIATSTNRGKAIVAGMVDCLGLDQIVLPAASTPFSPLRHALEHRLSRLCRLSLAKQRDRGAGRTARPCRTIGWEHIGLTGNYLLSEMDKFRERFRPLRFDQNGRDA